MPGKRINQEMTRRDMGWAVGKAFATAAGAEFFARWLAAAQPHQHGRGNPSAPPEPDRWTDYKPQFFSAVEFRMLGIYTAILIPSDDTPGAREANVAPFIDFVVNAAAEYAPMMQMEWRTSMAWLRGQNFDRLSIEDRSLLIEQSSAPERDSAKSHDGYPTYRLIKNAAIHAFYTSRVGLVDVLEYKGLAYLTEFPACNHPEHRKV